MYTDPSQLNLGIGHDHQVLPRYSKLCETEVLDVLQIYIFYVTLLELQKLLEQSAERETSEKHSRVLKES